jgi:hypothetical protein
MDLSSNQLVEPLGDFAPKIEKLSSFPSIYPSLIETGWRIKEETFVVETKERRKRSGKKGNGKRTCKPPCNIEKKITYYHLRPPKDSKANQWSEKSVPRIHNHRLYVLPSWYYEVATEHSVKYCVPSLVDICLNKNLKPYFYGRGNILDWCGQSFLNLFMFS